MALQLCTFYEEVYTTEYHHTHDRIKNTSFVKHFAKEIKTSPIIKSKNVQFHTDILNPAHKNDIIIDTKIT